MGEARRRGSRQERIERAKQMAEGSTDAVIFVGMSFYDIGVKTSVQTWDDYVRPLIAEFACKPEEEVKAIRHHLEAILPGLDKMFTEAFDAQEQPNFGETKMIAQYSSGEIESFSWKAFCRLCVDYAVCCFILEEIPIPLIKPEVANEHLGKGRFADETVEKAANDDMEKIANVTVILQ